MDINGLKANLAQTWGRNNPILQGDTLQMLIDAGNKLPSTMDRTLPIILALRETQGGKYLKGQNNIFNIRGGDGQFVNYPDLKTAIFGGSNPLYGNVQSKGLVGQLNGPIYKDYQQSGDIKDLWKHWSPTADNNGDLPTQERDYGWMKDHLEKGVQPMVAAAPPRVQPVSQPQGNFSEGHIADYQEGRTRISPPTNELAMNRQAANTPANFPGYIKPQAPPSTIDINKVGSALGGLWNSVFK